MAHYAFIDENNIVVDVITGNDETETYDGVYWEHYYGKQRGLRCLRTSYHNNMRGIYAGIGFTYDAENDVFVAPYVPPYDPNVSTK